MLLCSLTRRSNFMQLTHGASKFKQIGVVGSLAVLKSLCEAIEKKAYPRWTAAQITGMGLFGPAVS